MRTPYAETAAKPTVSSAQPSRVSVVSSRTLHETLPVFRSAKVVNDAPRDEVSSALLPDGLHALIDVYASLVQRDRLEKLERLLYRYKKANSRCGVVH